MADLLQVAPSLLDVVGGNTVTLTGTFVLGRPYAVYSVTDAQTVLCYAGVSGQGSQCVPQDTATLTCACPPVAPGAVHFDVVDMVTGTRTSSQDVRAETPFLLSRVYAFRSAIRDILDVGETDPSQLPDAVAAP